VMSWVVTAVIIYLSTQLKLIAALVGLCALTALILVNVFKKPKEK